MASCEATLTYAASPNALNRNESRLKVAVGEVSQDGTKQS